MLVVCFTLGFDVGKDSAHTIIEPSLILCLAARCFRFYVENVVEDAEAQRDILKHAVAFRSIQALKRPVVVDRLFRVDRLTQQLAQKR